VSATPSTRPKFCHLSPEELTDKRKKGECYVCPEKFFTLDHICPMKRVFVMELDDQEDLESVAEDVGISSCVDRPLWRQYDATPCQHWGYYTLCLG
jgi:hypothetical protein